MEKSRFVLSRSLALLHRQQSCFRTSLQKPFCRTYSTTHAAAMGRMHSRGKGILASALPYKRTLPSWLKISSQDVEESIHKFAKKGMTPSQISVILCDLHGIAQVKSVTGSKILRILKAQGVESVLLDYENNKITVPGEADPWKLKEIIESKKKKNVTIISPVNPPKKKDDSEKNLATTVNSGTYQKMKSDSKKPKEVPEPTIVLKIRLHCEGCIRG